MGNKTNIGWTDFTSNPVRYRDRATGARVQACVKVSAGCVHCYSETQGMNARLRPKGWMESRPFTAANMEKLEPFIDEKELHWLLTSGALAGKKVFVCDMTDLFGEWVPDELIDRVFATMALRLDVTFQVLTKRATRQREYMTNRRKWPGRPLPNVWMGVSVENQKAADLRIPDLLATPAAVRFVSAEPLLEYVNLKSIKWRRILVNPADYSRFGVEPPDEMWSCNNVLISRPADSLNPEKRGLDWVIVGGESGAGFRAADGAVTTKGDGLDGPDGRDGLERTSAEAICRVVNDCVEAGVAVYVKQDAGRWPGWKSKKPIIRRRRKRRLLKKRQGEKE